MCVCRYIYICVLLCWELDVWDGPAVRYFRRINASTYFILVFSHDMQYNHTFMNICIYISVMYKQDTSIINREIQVLNYTSALLL